MYQNGHYEVIFKNIIEKIRNSQNEDLFSKYEQIITKLDDKIVKLFIDNYSNISYLITKKHMIVPIPPVPMPKNKTLPCIYSFIQLEDIKIGMLVLDQTKN